MCVCVCVCACLCLIVCDIETSTTRRPRPGLVVMPRNENCYQSLWVFFILIWTKCLSVLVFMVDIIGQVTMFVD